MTMLPRCGAEGKQCGKVSSPAVLSTNGCKEDSKEGFQVTQAQKATVRDSGLTAALKRAPPSALILGGELGGDRQRQRNSLAAQGLLKRPEMRTAEEVKTLITNPKRQTPVRCFSGSSGERPELGQPVLTVYWCAGSRGHRYACLASCFKARAAERRRCGGDKGQPWAPKQEQTAATSASTLRE